MKGLFNIQGSQVDIDLVGESWTRDQIIKGKVQLPRDHKLAEQSLAMAYCDIDLRKLKKKDAKAFSILKTIPFEADVFEYPLEIDPIIRKGSHCYSDGTFSLALLVGDLSDPLSCAQLQLPTKTRDLVNEILKLFETFKRCSVKSIKNKKNDIEVKLVTPQSGDMAQIDTLAIIFAFKDEALKLTYQFQVKKLVVGGAGVETKKEKLNFVQTLEKKEYMSFGQLDQDKMIKKIEEAISSSKGLV